MKKIYILVVADFSFGQTDISKYATLKDAHKAMMSAYKEDAKYYEIPRDCRSVEKRCAEFQYDEYWKRYEIKEFAL